MEMRDPLKAYIGNFKYSQIFSMNNLSLIELCEAIMYLI
jgi:hypothetical protein